ncbi:hypothetical protein RUND412_010748, partial [Rhizina undulata]
LFRRIPKHYTPPHILDIAGIPRYSPESSGIRILVSADAGERFCHGGGVIPYGPVDERTASERRTADISPREGMSEVLFLGFWGRMNLLLSRGVPPGASMDNLTPVELAAIEKAQHWGKTGNAYALEHATRSATIGISLASNPISLLAWIGEKILEWTDEDPPLDKILEMVTLWWFTQTFPKGIYSYRGLIFGVPTPEAFPLSVPFEFSNFAHEIAPAPESWCRVSGDLVIYGHHEKTFRGFGATRSVGGGF